MKQNFIFFTLMVLVVLSFSNMEAQILTANRLGIGANIGVQKIFCDKSNVVKTTGFGGAIEAHVKYKISPRYFTVASLGYGELSDGNLISGDCYFSTDVINFDVKAAFNLITEGNIIPYAYLGLGAIYFQVRGPITTANTSDGKYYFKGAFDPSFIIGGGLEAKISPAVAFDFSIDYRFTGSDHLDGWAGGNSKDGYLNIRTGATYYLARSSGFGTPSETKSTQGAPIEEIAGEGAGESPDDELNSLIEGLDSHNETSDANLNMEEYIKLKSKVDQLNDAITQKELEIEELKTQLANRKEKINELEQQLRNRGGAVASSLDVDISDFASSYEQALQQYYSREYDAAIYLFSMLLETSPTHRLSSNCQYWLGECYFGQGDYSMALDAFKKVLAYDQSFKKDDALLMSGRCYIFKGDKQTALSMFNQLINDYPDSEYYQKAQQYASGL